MGHIIKFITKYLISVLLTMIIYSFNLNNLNAQNIVKDSIEIDWGMGLQRESPKQLCKFIRGKRFFSYNILADNTLDFKSIDFDSCKVLIDSSFITPFNVKTNYILKQIDQKNEIFLSYYTNLSYFDNSNDSIALLDSFRIKIFIKDKEYLADSLFFGADYKDNYPIIYNPNISFIDAIYSLKSRNDSLIVLYVKLISENNFKSENRPIVINANSNLLCLHLSQSTNSPYCFNDFDNDGKIEYVSWNYYDNRNLELYRINDTGFVKDKNKHLEIVKIPNELYGAPYIDTSKSSWFFNLKKCIKKQTRD